MFTKVYYNVYRGTRLSICDKPPPSIFMNILLHADRFDVHIQTSLPGPAITFTNVYICPYVVNYHLLGSLVFLCGGKPLLVQYVALLHLQTCMTGQKILHFLVNNIFHDVVID